MGRAVHQEGRASEEREEDEEGGEDDDEPEDDFHGVSLPEGEDDDEYVQEEGEGVPSTRFLLKVLRG